MNKVVLITGAVINTGVAIVEKFAKEGWDVVFSGRANDDVSLKEKEYKAKFPNVNFYGYNLEALLDDQNINFNDVDLMIEDLKKKNITINSLVLCAADQGLNLEIFKDDFSGFQRVINTNVCWNYYIIEKIAPFMIENKGGSIIFINSNTAYKAIPNRIAYSASKSGQLGLMRALAFDLGKYNITVNAILPGMIRTQRWIDNPDFYKKVPSRFTPIGDVADGSDIADAVFYFASSARNTTGAELTIDGGNTIQLYPIIPDEFK